MEDLFTQPAAGEERQNREEEPSGKCLMRYSDSSRFYGRHDAHRSCAAGASRRQQIERFLQEYIENEGQMEGQEQELPEPLRWPTQKS